MRRAVGLVMASSDAARAALLVPVALVERDSMVVKVKPGRSLEIENDGRYVYLEVASDGRLMLAAGASKADAHAVDLDLVEVRHVAAFLAGAG